MKVEVKDNKLHIEIDLQKPTLSKSNKTLIVATTNGFTTSTAQVDGKPVSVSINAFIPK